MNRIIDYLINQYYYIRGYRWINVTEVTAFAIYFELGILTKGNYFIYPISLIEAKDFRKRTIISNNVVSNKFITKSQFVQHFNNGFYK